MEHAHCAAACWWLSQRASSAARSPSHVQRLQKTSKMGMAITAELDSHAL